MESINLTIPAISPELIAAIQSENTIATQTEVEAVRALRERCATLAKHNGYVKIGSIVTCMNSGGTLRDESFYYESPAGTRVRGLLAHSGFGESLTTEFTGRYNGTRLYLTEEGAWLSIRRDGSWSNWQGSPSYWSCGRFADYDDADQFECGGGINTITDEQVTAHWSLEDIAKELGKSLQTMAEKLPVRLTRIRQRTELASQLLNALKVVA